MIKKPFLLQLFRTACLTLLPMQVCAANTDVQRMDELINSYLVNKQFTGTVLIAKGDDILLNKGYGAANIAWNIPNSPATKFRIASVSKQFTAAAILLLAEDGKLSLGDSVTRHLPRSPSGWRQVTLFQLLTHTSGMGDYNAYAEYVEGVPMKSEQVMAMIRKHPLASRPGKQFVYSNSGYAILGAVIEKVSGLRYCKFMQDRVFTPLAMHDSGCDVNAEVIPGRASGYVNERGRMTNAPHHDVGEVFADGGLYSTAADMLRWQKALYGGKLLSSASLTAMTTAHTPGYGMGLELASPPSQPLFGHGGHLNGFTSRISYRPDDALHVIVLSNMGMGYASGLGHRLRSVASGEAVILNSERKEMEVDTRILARRVGKYRFPGELVSIRLDGERLQFKMGDQDWLTLSAESDSKFFTPTIDAQFEFVRTAKEPESLVLHQNGRHIVMPRIACASCPSTP